MRVPVSYRGAYGRIALFLLCSSLILPADLPAQDFEARYREAFGRFSLLADFEGDYLPGPGLKEAQPAAVEAPYGLEELLVLARAGNPALRAARMGVEAAEADLKGAKARRLPGFSVETSGSFIGNPLGPISIKKDQFAANIPPGDVLVYKGMESTQYSFKLIGQLPLFTWGKIGLGVDVAREALGAAALQLEKAEHELALRIKGRYEALGYLAEALPLLDLQDAVASRLLTLAEESAKAGFITRSELLSARIRLQELKLARAVVEEKRDGLLAELSRDAGLPELALADLALAPAPLGRAPWPEREAYAVVQAGSYDLALLDALAGIKGGLASLAELQARPRPDLGLRAELSYAGPRLPFVETDWFRQDDYQFTLSVGSSGSAFGSTLARSEAQKARADALQASESRADAAHALRAFVRSSYLGLELQRVKIEYALLKQESWQADLGQKATLLGLGSGSESEYLGVLLEALGGLAEAYGTMADYRALLLGLEGAAGMASR